MGAPNFFTSKVTLAESLRSLRIGTNERNTRAVQVPTQCSALCSADCFVLNWEAEKQQYGITLIFTIDACRYIWHGIGSEDIEREYARTAASFLRSITKSRSA